MRVRCEDCLHEGKEDICEVCSNNSGDEYAQCSCHINPPCSYCVELKYEEK